jgi:hypothetical protein
MKAFRTVTLLILAFVLHSAAVFAQDVSVRGGFVADSTRVGDEVFFYLTARYPKDMQVLFPDTSFNFSPFELIRKRYYVTETKNNISYDSAIYHLRTFEVEPYQSLKLPVFEVKTGDSTRFESRTDTLKLSQLIRTLPDSLMSSLPLKPSVAYEHVPKQVNYSAIAFGAATLAMIGSFGYILFGAAIRRYYKMKKLRLAHEEFLNTYTRLIADVRVTFSKEKIEAAMIIWKRYMEKITGRPYTRLTTRETITIEKDRRLQDNLRLVDSAIYGSNKAIGNSLEDLKVFVEEKFQGKLEEVKNAE